MSTLTPIGRALIIRRRADAAHRGGRELDGAALAFLRSDVLTGAHDSDPATGDEAAKLAEIASITRHDMPPPIDLVSLLLETASQRLGGLTRAQVWRTVGVNPNRGRGLLSRNAGALDWPLWFTLHDLALGKPPPHDLSASER